MVKFLTVLLVLRQFFNLGGILLGNTAIFLKMKIIKAIHFLFKMKFNISENISLSVDGVVTPLHNRRPEFFGQRFWLRAFQEKLFDKFMEHHIHSFCIILKFYKNYCPIHVD